MDSKVVARIIRESQTRIVGSNYTLVDKEELVRQFILVFKREQPNFDENRFRKESNNVEV